MVWSNTYDIKIVRHILMKVERRYLFFVCISRKNYFSYYYLTKENIRSVRNRIFNSPSRISYYHLNHRLLSRAECFVPIQKREKNYFTKENIRFVHNRIPNSPSETPHPRVIPSIGKWTEASSFVTRNKYLVPLRGGSAIIPYGVAR